MSSEDAVVHKKIPFPKRLSELKLDMGEAPKRFFPKKLSELAFLFESSPKTSKKSAAKGSASKSKSSNRRTDGKAVRKCTFSPAHKRQSQVKISQDARKSRQNIAKCQPKTVPTLIPKTTTRHTPTNLAVQDSTSTTTTSSSNKEYEHLIQIVGNLTSKVNDLSEKLDKLVNVNDLLEKLDKLVNVNELSEKLDKLVNVNELSEKLNKLVTLKHICPKCGNINTACTLSNIDNENLEQTDIVLQNTNKNVRGNSIGSTQGPAKEVTCLNDEYNHSGSTNIGSEMINDKVNAYCVSTNLPTIGIDMDNEDGVYAREKSDEDYSSKLNNTAGSVTITEFLSSPELTPIDFDQLVKESLYNTPIARSLSTPSITDRQKSEKINLSTPEIFSKSVHKYNNMRQNISILCTPKITMDGLPIMTPGTQVNRKRYISRKVQEQIMQLESVPNK